jgi:hypothetical protein
VQFLVPIDLHNVPDMHTHYSLVDTNGVVLSEDTIVGSPWDTDLCISYAAPELESHEFEVKLDGTDEVAYVPSISTVYDTSTSTIIVPIAPACVPGIVIRILDYEAPSAASAIISAVVPRRAYGAVDAHNMVNYGYGKIRYDPARQEGFRFSYKGRFRYAKQDQPSESRAGYDRPGLGSSLYSYYKEYTLWYNGGSQSRVEWESSDATNSNWDDISGDVYKTQPTAQIDGTRYIAKYYGELFTMLGADGTSDYTFKDQGYFSSLKGPYNGIVPCGCMHQDQPNETHEYGEFIDTTINVRVLKVNLDRNDPYIILAFATTEVQYDSSQPEKWTQGGSAIYKFALEPFGYATMIKSLTM